MDYDTIIFCGGIYASGIAGLSFLKKNTNQLKDKEIKLKLSIVHMLKT